MTTDQETQRDALVERLFSATLGMMDLLTVHMGDRLGFYAALAEGDGLTSAELAARAETSERQTREWLEQQAVSGILDVNDVGGPPDARRYRMPEGHREVLLDPDDLNHLVPLARFMASLAKATDRLVDSVRSGRGVSWEEFGEDARLGQEGLNRPAFVQLLGSEWFPAIPDVHQKLASGSARVADIACGTGWATIAFAKAYPEVEVHGYDRDQPSIERARQNAREAGVAERVRFETRDAGDPALAGRYDLVTIFESLHDFSQPVSVLDSARRLAAEGGTVVVMDEKTAEAFTAPGDDLERLFYGGSVLCCLPAGLAETPSAGTGTVMRPDTVRRYAAEAGFKDVEILPIEHDMFRFYRLHP